MEINFTRLSGESLKLVLKEQYSMADIGSLARKAGDEFDELINIGFRYMGLMSMVKNEKEFDPTTLLQEIGFHNLILMVIDALHLMNIVADPISDKIDWDNASPGEIMGLIQNPEFMQGVMGFIMGIMGMNGPQLPEEDEKKKIPPLSV